MDSAPAALRARLTRLWIGILVATAAVHSPRTAAAEGERTARILDAEASRLMEQRQYAQACPLFAASARAEPGVGVSMRLALCYEQSGQLASAFQIYNQAAAQARAVGQKDVADLALRRAGPLASKIPYVIFHSPAARGSGAQLELDGIALPKDAWDVALPVDAGTHRVQASAPGMAPFTTTFIAVVDASTVITVDFQLAAKPQGKGLAAHTAAELAGSAHTTAEVPGAVHSAAQVAPRSSYWTAQHTAAVVAGAIGVVGVAVGTGFGLSAMGTMNHARAECADTGRGCTSPNALRSQDEASTAASLSNVGFGVGVAGLGAGLVLWLTAPSANSATEHTSSWVIAPAATSGSTSLVVSHHW